MQRPAAETVFDAVRAWVAREYGPGASVTAVSIHLAGQPQPVQLPAPAYSAPPAYTPPRAGGSPPNRDRNVSDECLADVLDALRAAGHRMTGPEIITALDRGGRSYAESTVRHTLSHFARGVDAPLSNDPHARPRGYGLPEWA